MEKKTDIRFTPAAEEQLERFKQDQVELLKEIIIQEKMYPGADFVEITASDIQEQSRRIYITKNKKSDIRYLVLFIYFIGGLSTFLYGVYYYKISNIINNNPTQAGFIFLGFFTSILSVLLIFVIRQKENKKRDYYFEHKKPIDIDDIKISPLSFELYKEFLEKEFEKQYNKNKI